MVKEACLRTRSHWGGACLVAGLAACGNTSIDARRLPPQTTSGVSTGTIGPTTGPGSTSGAGGAIGAGGSSGILVDSGNGGDDSGSPFANCASDTRTTNPKQVDLMVMLDQSGSMVLEGDRWRP